MVNLAHIEAGNWVVFSNGKRKEVTTLIRDFKPNHTGISVTCLVKLKFNHKNKEHIYTNNGVPEKNGALDIVSVWSHKPTRKEIVAAIRKGSFLHLRDGSILEVTATNIGSKIHTYPLDIFYRDPLDTDSKAHCRGYTLKGRYGRKSVNSLYDIMSVDNRNILK